VYVIFGRYETDGTIQELGRALLEDGIDPIVEIPGYATALRRGTNVNFHSDNEELVGKLRPVTQLKERGPRQDAARERETGRDRTDTPSPTAHGAAEDAPDGSGGRRGSGTGSQRGSDKDD
jgi:hypothetical protein